MQVAQLISPVRFVLPWTVWVKPCFSWPAVSLFCGFERPPGLANQTDTISRRRTTRINDMGYTVSLSEWYIHYIRSISIIRRRASDYKHIPDW